MLGFFFFYQRDIFSFEKAALENAQLFSQYYCGCSHIYHTNSIISLCATWLDSNVFSLVNCCTVATMEIKE
jgi:hypothetical protein